MKAQPSAAGVAKPEFFQVGYWQSNERRLLGVLTAAEAVRQTSAT